MKHRKLIGVITLVLAVVLAAGAVLSVGAANTVSDVDGDQKITAFDAQMIAESNAGLRELDSDLLSIIKDISVQDILRFLRGEAVIDVGDTNGDGVLEIYTVAGLQQLHEQPDGKFILAADLDLEGADWTPVAGFSGSLDGNGKIISNFTINTAVAQAPQNISYNQGFFGDTATGVQITDLHLQDVTLNAAENATHLGFFAGSLRGSLTGCTVTGTLCDTREEYTENVNIGVFAGRIINDSNGSITGGTSLSFTDEYGRKTTENLCANVVLQIENDDINKAGQVPGKVGLSGYVPSGSSATGTWVDTSNSTSLLSETLQERRQKVVDYMNAMATVKWTPTETLYYTAANGTDQTIVAGKTHIGLPYNFHNGSYERFMTQMATQDANGVWTANSDLTSCGFDDSVPVKYYIRPYTNSNAPLGAGIQVTALDEYDPVLSIDDNGFLYFTEDGTNYYYGSDAKSEYIHILGNSVNDQCMRLYDVSGSTPVAVTKPVVGTIYKLGTVDPAGKIWYFNGTSNNINGYNSLITTSVVGNATDMYLETADGGYYLRFDKAGVWSDTGFYLTMGNACNTSVSWAWRQVSSVFTNDGARSSAFGYEGGFNPRGAQSMIPTDYNREHYGMYPIGDWQATTVNESGKVVSAEWDPTKAAYSCTDQTYTPQILNDNGLDTIYETYAQTHKGDALTCYVAHWTEGNPGPGGHVRMITGDPVVIRDASGVIDGNASYLIETEQGVGFNRSNHDFPSTWAYAEAHSFYDLAGKPASMPTAWSTKTYLPMTIRALQEEYQPEVFISEIRNSSIDGAIPALSPTEGLMYSSHTINSVTLTLKNTANTTLYTHTAFTGVSADTSVSGANNNRVYMADLHAEAFYEAAKELNLSTRPNRYKISVEVTLSNGDTIPLVTDRAYTYVAPVAD